MKIFSQSVIKEFNDSYDLKKAKDFEQKRKDFVGYYTKNRIKKLSLKEYVVGFGNNNKSFCYELETELKCLGDMHGSNAVKFGVYYGKEGKNNPEKKYRTSVERYGTEPEVVLEKVKDEIIALLDAGERNDVDAINKRNITDMFRGKILATYYPEKFLNIFSKTHLEYFLNKLEIDYKGKKNDILSMQKAILDYKKQYFDKWEIGMFTCFLYEVVGKPSDELKLCNQEEDNKLTQDINSEDKPKLDKNHDLSYKGSQDRDEPNKTSAGYVYPRKRWVARKALEIAGYKCELDETHKTFINKNGKPYVEPHHLIPMCCQKDFEKGLDVAENVVALCSNCHNEIHYGKNAKKLIEKLYEKRKKLLESAEIGVTFKDLKKMYK